MKAYKRMSLMLVFTGFLTFGSILLRAQQAKNVVLADFVSTETLYQASSFPYNTPDSPVADVCGWTYGGNEYALVCLGSKNVAGSRLVMVKVTDPNSLQVIKTIKRGSPDGLAIQNGPRDVQVFGNYAYVSQDNATVDNYYVNLVTALNAPSDPFAGVVNFAANGRRVHNVHVNPTHGLLFLSDIFGTYPVVAYDINNFVPSANPVVSILRVISGYSHELSAATLSATAGRIFNAANVDGVTVIDYTYDKNTLNFDVGTARNHKYNARRGTDPSNFNPPMLNPVGHDAVASTNGNYLYSTEERFGFDDPSDRQLAA